MNSTAPAPWGSPPTPVLPRWFIEQMPFTPLPWALRQNPDPGTPLEVVGDLTRFWEHRSRSLTSDEHDALVALATPTGVNNHSGPPEDLVVIPAEADILRLLGYPLRRRTRNCIRRAVHAKKLREGQPVTVGQLLSLQSFGIRSLLDLMCIVEAALNAELLLPSPTGRSPALTTPSDASTALPDPSDPLSIAWDSATVLLRRLFIAASEIDGAQTLGDALNSDLGGLATTLGMADHLNGVAITDLTGEPALAHESLSALSEFWESLSAVERSILEKRLLTANPLTLEEVGQTANLTRERIRQIEKRVKNRLDDPPDAGAEAKNWMSILAVLLCQAVGPITSQDDLEVHVTAAFPTHNKSKEDNGAMTEMARHLLRQELGYSRVDGLCLSPAALAVIRELKDRAGSLADEIGLLEESELQGWLPDESWHQHWETLLEQSGLHRLSNHLALRDTSKARAKAALLSIGRPATKEEIGELSDLRPDRAGAQLSLLPGVVRADKYRWGLAEWVDDEYEGIPAEIIQRVNEDGGSTRLNRLLEELPRMFGVRESSVRAYLDTPAFRVEHGWVSIADNPEVHLGLLQDVIDGYDDNGDPYWTFEIEDRHLSGYSIHGVPGEVAAALSCEFGGRTTTTVRSPADCQDISVIWRTTSMHGPEIGRLGSALRAVGVRGGDTMALIIHGPSEISVTRAPKTAQPAFKGGTHTTLRAISPTFADGSKEYTGVQIGTPIAGRLTTTAPIGSGLSGRSEQDHNDSES